MYFVLDSFLLESIFLLCPTQFVVEEVPCFKLVLIKVMFKGFFGFSFCFLLFSESETSLLRETYRMLCSVSGAPPGGAMSEQFHFSQKERENCYLEGKIERLPCKQSSHLGCFRRMHCSVYQGFIYFRLLTPKPCGLHLHSFAFTGWSPHQ